MIEAGFWVGASALVGFRARAGEGERDSHVLVLDGVPASLPPLCSTGTGPELGARVLVRDGLVHDSMSYGARSLHRSSTTGEATPFELSLPFRWACSPGVVRNSSVRSKVATAPWSGGNLHSLALESLGVHLKSSGAGSDPRETWVTLPPEFRGQVENGGVIAGRPPGEHGWLISKVGWGARGSAEESTLASPTPMTGMLGDEVVEVVQGAANLELTSEQAGESVSIERLPETPPGCPIKLPGRLTELWQSVT